MRKGNRLNSKPCKPSLASYSLQGRSLYYDFVTYNYQNKTIPDVLLTLKTSGAYDAALYMYCNPAWFSATEGNAVPRPANAIFKSGRRTQLSSSQHRLTVPASACNCQCVPVCMQHASSPGKDVDTQAL